MTTDASNHSDAASSTARPGSQVLLPVGFSLLWLVVSAVFALQISAAGLMPWTTAFGLSLLDWGPWCILTPLVLWLARRMPLGPGTWRWALPAHLVASVLMVGTIEVTMSALSLRKELLMPPPEGRRPLPEGFDKGGGRREPRRPPPAPAASFRFFDRARIAVPVYWMLVAAATAVAQQRRVAERELRALRAEARLAEARLAALQAQLNPHFLFNTLNTIAQLIYDNPPAAESSITALGGLLRAALAAQHRREVPLAEELQLIEQYCAIQQVRFADRLRFEYEIDPAARSAAVPTLLLQPLVENAVIHGVAPARGAGRVWIRARLTAERLQLEVADTGNAEATTAGAGLQFREGVGLGNTRARLETLYGDRHRFSVARAVEGGVSVRLEIPRRVAT
ncbi:MAG: histidine kinase [Verrucomicrobia bacterium]|nr:histidine kinase [Verrucomicrobiota bacterium]